MSRLDIVLYAEASPDSNIIVRSQLAHYGKGATTFQQVTSTVTPTQGVREHGITTAHFVATAVGSAKVNSVGATTITFSGPAVGTAKVHGSGSSSITFVTGFRVRTYRPTPVILYPDQYPLIVLRDPVSAGAADHHPIVFTTITFDPLATPTVQKIPFGDTTIGFTAAATPSVAHLPAVTTGITFDAEATPSIAHLPSATATLTFDPTATGSQAHFSVRATSSITFVGAVAEVALHRYSDNTLLVILYPNQYPLIVLHDPTGKTFANHSPVVQTTLTFDPEATPKDAKHPQGTGAVSFTGTSVELLGHHPRGTSSIVFTATATLVISHFPTSHVTMTFTARGSPSQGHRPNASTTIVFTDAGRPLIRHRFRGKTRLTFTGGSATPIIRSAAILIPLRNHRRIYRPGDKTWAWVNQGAVSIDTSKGVHRLTCLSEVAANLHMRVTAVPALPYTITAQLEFFFNRESGSNFKMGLLWRNSGSGKVLLAGLQMWSEFETEVMGFDSPTVYTGVFLGSQVKFVGEEGQPIWLRIVNNNTNRQAYTSIDGDDWTLFYNQTKISSIGVEDQIGFGIDARNYTSAALPNGMNLISWRQT